MFLESWSIFLSQSSSVCVCTALFLTSLRFCVHYCIDRDTVQKENPRFVQILCWTVHNKLKNDLETNNTQTNVIDLTIRTLVTHTNTHAQTDRQTDLHTRCACVCVCVCVCMSVCACVCA